MARGVVKFFNPAKGFGFIAPDDGGPDVFVHVSGLTEDIDENDQVGFDIQQDRRSGKVSAVDVRVLQRAPAARPQQHHGRSAAQSEPRDFGGRREAAGAGSGVVKWFNTTKGFGFIQPDSGGGDVFVHISAVERAGLKSLQDGQTVTFDIEADRRTGELAATNLRLG